MRVRIFPALVGHIIMYGTIGMRLVVITHVLRSSLQTAVYVQVLNSSKKKMRLGVASYFS